jgi:citrate/tricarballylate utilization protein
MSTPVTALQALAREAQQLAGAAPGTVNLNTPAAHEAEVARVLNICNACRYCEGFCAVFPAMTRRLEFPAADVHYLANLCHNCGACLHACQYAPPHDFAVAVPQAMARVRGDTYSQYAFPRALGGLYRSNGLTVALASAAGLAIFLLLALARTGSLWHEPMAGDFYKVFPHNLLVALFGSVFGFAVLSLAIGVTRFWRDIRATDGPLAAPKGIAAPALAEATHDVLRLKYLDGGHGEGCNNEDDAFTHWRRRFHHATFYGFMLCFASTSVATLYHYGLNLQAPYALTSLPVLLGTVGGLGLLVGPAGLLWLNLRRHPLQGAAEQKPMDHGFIALLWLTSLSGLLLLAGRDTSAMATLLAIHLGIVMALFLTLPFGKFAHGVYRSAALLKWALERRQPNRLGLGSD